MFVTCNQAEYKCTTDNASMPNIDQMQICLIHQKTVQAEERSNAKLTQQNRVALMNLYIHMRKRTKAKQEQVENVREPQKWHREMRKRRRKHGKYYESVNGIRVPMKSSKPVSCKCKYKCTTKFDKDKRVYIRPILDNDI